MYTRNTTRHYERKTFVEFQTIFIAEITIILQLFTSIVYYSQMSLAFICNVFDSYSINSKKPSGYLIKNFHIHILQRWNIFRNDMIPIGNESKSFHQCHRSNNIVSVVIKSKSVANRLIFMRTNAMILSYYFCSRRIKSIQSSFDSLFRKSFIRTVISANIHISGERTLGSLKDMPIYVIWNWIAAFHDETFF